MEKKFESCFNRINQASQMMQEAKMEKEKAEYDLVQEIVSCGDLGLLKPNLSRVIATIRMNRK